MNTAACFASKLDPGIPSWGAAVCLFCFYVVLVKEHVIRGRLTVFIRNDVLLFQSHIVSAVCLQRRWSGAGSLSSTAVCSDLTSDDGWGWLSRKWLFVCWVNPITPPWSELRVSSFFGLCSTQTQAAALWRPAFQFQSEPQINLGQRIPSPSHCCFSVSCSLVSLFPKEEHPRQLQTLQEGTDSGQGQSWKLRDKNLHFRLNSLT